MDEPRSSPAPAPATQREAREDWENEGGGLKSWSADSLPEGITARQVTEYTVGPYRYTDRALAEAEWHRQQAPAAGTGGLQNKP